MTGILEVSSFLQFMFVEKSPRFCSDRSNLAASGDCGLHPANFFSDNALADQIVGHALGVWLAGEQNHDSS